MPRLFSGIELPSELRDQLQRLSQPLPSARWIAPEDLHITLRFLGDVPSDIAREFAANLEQIMFDPFSIRIQGLATFGGDAPRSMHAVIEPSEALSELARANEKAARRAGLKPEGRKFMPHITLARLNVPRTEPLARYLSRRGGFVSTPFTVDHFVLFSAKPGVGGGPYVVEQVFHSTLGQYDDDGWDDGDEHDHAAY